jgi:hypothetical protein
MFHSYIWPQYAQRFNRRQKKSKKSKIPPKKFTAKGKKGQERGIFGVKLPRFLCG